MSRSIYSKLHRRFGPTLAESERCARIEEKLNLERAQWQVTGLLSPCKSMLSDTKVAIVGGGLAGLSAAWALCPERVLVTVFEAQNEVGGRVRTLKSFTKDRIIEAGAELIGANHSNWVDLARHFGMALTVGSTEDHYSRAGLELKLWIDKPIDRDDAKKLTERMEKEVLKPIGKDAAKVTDPISPWLEPALEKWDKMSVADKLVALKIKKTDVLWKAMKLLIGNNNVVPMEKMNYLALLCLVKAGQFGSEDSELMGYWRETEVFRCAYGNQTLAAKMVGELEAKYKCKIQRRTAVTSIDIGKRVTLKWKNVDTTKQGQDSFDYVVLAIPPSVWGSIIITPHHPKDTIGLMQMGPAVKFLSNLSDRFWIKSKSAPSGASTKIGLIWEGTDNQTLLGEQGIELTVFAGGRVPTAAEFKDGLKDLYPKYTDNLKASKLVDWPSEPFIKTGYSSPKPGQVFTIAKELNEPYLGRMCFAGEHTSMDFFGYMEGALRSGARAAKCVIDKVCGQASKLTASRPPAKAPIFGGGGFGGGGAGRMYERASLESETEVFMQKHSSTDNTGEVESPFLNQELFVARSEDELEPRALALAAESLFQRAFEQGRTILTEQEQREEEFIEEEESPDTYDFAANEAEDEAALADLEDSIEERCEEEAPYAEVEEESSSAEEATSLEEEPLIREEFLIELEEEEAAYPLEEAAPAPGLRQRIVKIAKQEWNHWEQGKLSETDPKATPLLRKYLMNYRANALSESQANKKIEKRRPWSAVWVSYVMREARAGNAFTYAAAHTTFIAAAKQAAEKQDSSKFQAYEISAVKPEVGDLVCRDRAPKEKAPCAGTNFDNVHQGGISHSDIVVEVFPDSIAILGGNTRQTYPHEGKRAGTVGQRKIKVDEGGFVVPGQAKCYYFAIVKPPGAGAAVPSVPTVTPVPRPTPGAAKPPAELVRFAQRVLNATEGERLNDDGDLGRLTRGAIERFRKRYGLGSGGVLDAKTELALAQRALEEIRQQSLFGQFGVLDAATRKALVTFKSQRGIGTDATLDAATRAALADALAQRVSVPSVPEPVAGPVRNWAEVDPDQRMLYVTELLVAKYQYPVNGAAGLVGNLWAESDVLPNRVQDSKAATPMRALDHAGKETVFTAEQVMNRRTVEPKQGPLKAGIGIAQWTHPDRRAGLFQHTFQGQRLGAAIVYNMDAQVDYLVTELGSNYIKVDRVLRKAGVSLEDASDEVVYKYEIPGAILTKSTPPRKLPRTDPVVQIVFNRRRRHSRDALGAYRRAHPEP